MLAVARDFDVEAAERDKDAVRVDIAKAVENCIIANAGLTSATRILDCGCGTGLVTLSMAPKAGFVVAVGAAAGMLGQLEAKIARQGLKNIRTINGLIEETSGPGSAFDLVVCTQTLAQVTGVERTISALRNCPEPEGVLAVSEMEIVGKEAGFGELSRTAIAATVTRIGFAVSGVFDAIEIHGGAGKDFFTKRYYVLLATLADRPTSGRHCQRLGKREHDDSRRSFF